MVAILKEKNNRYYCSNCMMSQRQLRHSCCFCGCMFSNFQNVLYKALKDKDDYQRKAFDFDYYDDDRPR